jgi:UDP:flavonoid glycosyltransferase YjiC (YdhE family)
VIPPELQRPVLDTPETDPLPASANVQYVGPVVWQRSDSSLPEWVKQRSPEKPIIWVYSGNPRYAPVPTPIDSIVVIRAAIASLEDAPVYVVLTTGFQDLAAEFEALPANFFHAAHLPGHSMAAHCDLMVHHGSHRSVMTGLQSGTPAGLYRRSRTREQRARSGGLRCGRGGDACQRPGRRKDDRYE